MTEILNELQTIGEQDSNISCIASLSALGAHKLGFFGTIYFSVISQQCPCFDLRFESSDPVIY